MTSHAALHELDRVDRVVRDHSRWYRRYLFVLGAGTIAYYAAVNFASPPTLVNILVLSLCWVGFITALGRWVRSRPVMWRGIRRLRILLMALYFALVAGTVLLNVTVLQDAPWRWALGIVPAMPCLVGAWAVLRR